MKSNDFVIFALRSPLYPLVPNTILITLTGRKTGRKFTVPVNYYRAGNMLWVLVRRETLWWRNLRGGAGVVVRLNGRDVPAFAEAVTDEQAVAMRFDEYLHRLPQSARYFGITTENGVVDPEDLRRVAKGRVFVQLCLAG